MPLILESDVQQAYVGISGLQNVAMYSSVLHNSLHRIILIGYMVTINVSCVSIAGWSIHN